ncbi:MAG: AAA family ATPase [Spirochaetes bacterium]|nr:AAA family ATPase [Alphaproteobacteria bacterium]MCK5268275.1 AAA family ATPase [Spirochaetota bacterium]
MKIKRFIAKEVNGYLNFDIKFNEDLTFVTGINGTGKTSALNAIIALIFPRLDYLSNTTFKELKLEIKNNEKLYKLVAKKSSENTILTCAAFKNEKLTISRFEALEDMPSRHLKELEEDHYKIMLAKHAQNPIIKFIEKLPSPMYLGLERRSLSVDTEQRRRYYSPSLRMHKQRYKNHRSIFSRSIGQSLDEALYFARETFRNNSRKKVTLDETIRKELVLGLLGLDPIELAVRRKAPTKKELNSIKEARKNLQKLPDLLNIDKKIISKKIDPLFNFLDKKKKIFEKKLPKNIKDDDERIQNKMMAGIEWSFNQTHLSKISYLSKTISNYSKESEKISRHSNEFLETANSFLKDSGKTLSFSEYGELVFSLVVEQNDKERDIRTLSSGEIQLIVILTHLYFNPEVEKANVFIIDEPELSLHVQWQEKFVDGIMSASNKIQFIMATHSPSIILDKISNCIEIPVKQ